MHVLFLSPEFPDNQARFVRALVQVGARVTGIGERDASALSEELKGALHGYERVGNVGDDGMVHDVVRRVQAREYVDRLEATVESHVLTVARVREATGIPGLSTASAHLCRDKLAMKQFLRERGVACAAARSVATPDEALSLAGEVGYPLVLKPRDGAGASGAMVAKDEAMVRGYFTSLADGAAIIAEEHVDGHEGFYDTLTVDGEVRHEFISHYYPNVLEGMRQRWISPQIVVTNRTSEPGYDEVKALGRKVVELLGIGTAPTHMEWFFGSKGLRFSEIGARPPGVNQWDLYSAANDLDLYKEWADAIVHRQTWGVASRSHAAGIIALRPDRDGVVDHYEGVEELQRRFGQWVLRAHLPTPGSATQPIEAGYMANAWVQMRHPDYDELRGMLDTVGQMLKVRAR